MWDECQILASVPGSHISSYLSFYDFTPLFPHSNYVKRLLIFANFFFPAWWGAKALQGIYNLETTIQRQYLILNHSIKQRSIYFLHSLGFFDDGKIPECKVIFKQRIEGLFILRHPRISSFGVISIKQKFQGCRFWSSYFVFIKKPDVFSPSWNMNSSKSIYFYQ